MTARRPRTPRGELGAGPQWLVVFLGTDIEW
jgi:hypothetical protein